MLFMLLDQVRETFFLHRQVLDPMEVASTEPALFLSRTLAHLCAPVFVLLSGLSAYLYGQKHAGRGSVSHFLFKRGLFLVLLELTLVNLAWTFAVPPTVIYLQVIWAIGLSMLALSLLVWLPRALLLLLSLTIIAGHNLLDGVHFAPQAMLHVPWAVLHERGWIEWNDTLRLRTSYPVLPWIAVMGLGYALGPWFSAALPAARRQRRLLWFEQRQERRWIVPLTVMGSAPMFFYLLHLYVLKVLYLLALACFGLNQQTHFGFDAVWMVWLASAALAVALYPAVQWFSRLKARRRDVAWLKYF